MTSSCPCHDPGVFGHTACDRRPPHLVSEQAAQRHYEADVTRRSQWAQVARAVAMAAPRGVTHHHPGGTA